MKVTIEVYNIPKYDCESQVMCTAKYEIESFRVLEISDAEILAQGFDEVDPYGEYLRIRLTNGGVLTFRNSYVDMFKF